MKSPLVIYIMINKKSITVSNNLQLRSYVGTKNGMGLTNLCNQYALHGKELIIKKTEGGEKIKVVLIYSLSVIMVLFRVR